MLATCSRWYGCHILHTPTIRTLSAHNCQDLHYLPYFSWQISPQCFDFIRRLELSTIWSTNWDRWHPGYDPKLRAKYIGYTSFSRWDWQQVWQMVAEMKGLKYLSFTVSPDMATPTSTFKSFSKNDLSNEYQMFDALKCIKRPKEFQVWVPWKETPDLLLGDLPCKIIGPNRDIEELEIT
jgi:hypothetical protein